MKVLVIGGAGYIGSHVVKALRSAGYAVVVFDNLSSGLRENLRADASFIHGDILIPGAVLSALYGVDAVIHLAAFKAAGESMLQPEKYAVNNIAGTINILNAMSDAGVKHLVFSSSAAVYGEPEYLPIDEDHPTRPENFYGYTKLEIEQLLAWYDTLKEIRSSSLRYFNAAGYDPEGDIRGLEQNPANLLPVIMEVAIGKRSTLSVFGDDYETPDGTGVRDYIHVTDLADAHVRALKYTVENDLSLTVNLGSEHGLSVMDVLQAARSISGREIPATISDRRPGDPARLVASAKRARVALGWVPRYSDLNTLVQTSWEAYQNG